MICHEPMGVLSLAGQVKQHGVMSEEEMDTKLDQMCCAQQDKLWNMES